MYFLRINAFTLLLLCVVLSGCSKSNDKGTNIDPVTGKHPAGWATAGGGAHKAAFLASQSSCFECHGKDLKGGISSVSCFSASRSGINCHANGPGGHPAGWGAAASHGLHAKSGANGIDGFARCQICHGSDFSGGSSGRTCLDTAGCHGAEVKAPHAPRPWLSRMGAATHTTTDLSNAPACAVCHTAGANSSRKPSKGVPAGTVPDCFNNTLCHGTEGHPAGWKAATAHGTTAKNISDGANGFKYCTACHGSDYSGGSAEQTCLNTAGCHGSGIKAPHPAAPWRSGTRSHTSTDTSNDSQCALCHTAGANSSRKPKAGDPSGTGGCFNNTLCHGSEGHPAGWRTATAHGAEAKKAPTGSTGFSSCKGCHGATFANGTAPTCFNSSSCHGSGVYAPHAHKPWFSRVSGQPTHTNTDTGNVDVCAACHTAGANSEFGIRANAATGTAGCFNNTLCHFHAVDSIGTFKTPAMHGVLAKTDLSVCQSCHGRSGSTSFDGLTLTDGSKTIACSSCHTAAKAHPTDWQGGGSYSHRSARNTGSACGICHKTNAAGTSPLAAAPSCFNAAFTNALGMTRSCHASGPGVVPHAVPYNNHNATARSNFSYCLGCHQASANSAGSRPPGCQNCHITSPVTTPTGCESCHARPPAAQGYPNIAGSHGSHSTLNVVQNVDLTAGCNECHSGLGLGTIDHLNRARARSSSVQANPVVFGTQLASVAGNTPAYNLPAAGQCVNSYCHGATLTGGGSNKTPRWGQTDYLAATGCGTCHGYPPTSVRNGAAAHTASTACNTCHTHVNPVNNGFTNPALHIDGKVDVLGGNAHAVPYPGTKHKGAGAVTANCNGCHNSIRTGGSYPAVPSGSPPDCRACHISAVGIGCADCHYSPPNGATAPNRAFAHAKHFTSTITTLTVTCDDCHTGGGDPSLLHGYGSVKISFGPFAKTGALAPAFNSPAAGQCAGVYCHGATLTGGSSKTPAWNQTLSGCASCHGFPPVTASGIHTGMTAISCKGCHQHVNATGTGFDNSALHIDGRLDVNVLPDHPGATPTTSTVYPGATHKSAGGNVSSDCAVCHDTGTASISPTGSGYPSSAGTPPKCAGCHLTWSNADCSDCHGARAAGGRPNGTAFPNRQGLHGISEHSGRACTVCHPFTTGDTRHGWSNRTKSTNAQIVTTLGWNPGTRVLGQKQGSCNPSAGGFSGCHSLKSGWY